MVIRIKRGSSKAKSKRKLNRNPLLALAGLKKVIAFLTALIRRLLPLSIGVKVLISTLSPPLHPLPGATLL